MGHSRTSFPRTGRSRASPAGDERFSRNSRVHTPTLFYTQFTFARSGPFPRTGRKAKRRSRRQCAECLPAFRQSGRLAGYVPGRDLPAPAAQNAEHPGTRTVPGCLYERIFAQRGNAPELSGRSDWRAGTGYTSASDSFSTKGASSTERIAQRATTICIFCAPTIRTMVSSLMDEMVP